MSIKQNNIAYYIIFVLILVISLAPFLYFFSLSLAAYENTFRILFWPIDFVPSNYAKALELGNLGTAYLNSLFVTIFAMIVTLFIGASASYGLNNFKIRGKEIVFTLFISGMIISSESIIIPMFMNIKKLGMLNKWYTLPLVYIVIGLPFTILAMRTFFSTIPSSLIEAAQMEGAGDFTIFTKIVMPLAKSSLFSVGLILFIWNWDEFVLAITLISDKRLGTLPSVLSNLKGEYMIDYPVLAATLMLVIFPILLLYIFSQRYLIKGITAGAIK